MTKPYHELSELEDREFRRKHPELNLGFTEEEKREIEREMRRIDARIQAEKLADEGAEAAAEREPQSGHRPQQVGPRRKGGCCPLFTERISSGRVLA
jgi:hypothetical protein